VPKGLWCLLSLALDFWGIMMRQLDAWCFTLLPTKTSTAVTGLPDNYN